MPNQLSLAGAQETKPVHFAPIFTNRFFQGIWTQRNPLRDAGSTRIEEKFYGARGDAMIAGSNVELTTRLTPARRPGNSVYNSQTFSAVDYFYEFRLFNTNTEQIKVMVDTSTSLYDGTGPSSNSLVWTKSTGAGQTFMQYVANILFFGNGVDQKKWVQTLNTWTASTSYAINDMQTFFIDPNSNIQQLIAYAITSISNVAITSNVLTLTVGSTTDISVGSQYPLWDLTTATFLNGSIITVATSGGTTVTATFSHGDYASAADTGVVAQLQGGAPVSGSSAPTWNTSSIAPNNTTIDNTAVWANRGAQIENWGIVGPTTAPTINKGVGTSGWQTNTFYANNEVVVDSNGNLQQVTTAGTSGSTAPAWATTDGSTTTDNTVVWTQLETAAELTWAANFAYTTAKPFIIANAAGTNCLFEAVSSTYPVYTEVGGAYITANKYYHNLAFSGQCELRNAVDGGNNPGSGSYVVQATATGNSVLFNPPQFNGTEDPFTVETQWATINEAGNITGYTQPWGTQNQSYNMIVTGTITFPESGLYNCLIAHDDGMYWGMGVGASSGAQPTATGINNCPSPVATKTALNTYDVLGANNVNAVAGGFFDSFTVTIPAADSYAFEIDYCQFTSNQNLCMYWQAQTPIPGTPTSGATQPVWTAWSKTWTYAPKYPSVSEVNGTKPAGGSGPGPLSWNNIGPTSDYTWYSKTQFLDAAETTIIDPNGNLEAPYEAGVTGTKEPSFATGTNQLTPDNPNLTWINTGPASAPPSGTLQTVNGGWSYVIALVNTLTDTVSNAGLISTATGNFGGSAGVTVTGGLPDSIDPQVDYVAIFRTDDGGATYFLIPGIGNSIYTTTLAQYQANGYVDTDLDSALNILIEAPLESQNTPPPTGIVNLTYHLGCVFGSVGNTVYWSVGPDTVVGNGNEGFPPLNSAVFPSLVKRIVPTSIGALVFTVSDIYLLSGQNTSSSPIFSQPYATGIGLLSYNALDINGTTIYLFTADSQVASLDPTNGLSQVGFPIGDQFTLSNWSPANAYVTWHVDGSTDHALYVSDGQTGWFRMTATASPEVGLTWSPFATIAGGCKAVQSVEVLPGVHKLLIGPTSSGPILARDLTSWTDNGSSYAANFTIGSIVLAQPGQVAELAFVTTDATATGSKPVVSVLIDEIAGTFDNLPRFTTDPPQLVSPSSIYAQRFYFSQSQAPAICRHLQLQIAWPAENAGNELLSMTIFGAYMQED